ncbi:receptor-type tyrosine-protein phosphatase S-like [Exaiptasia diaphana]|uniref:protein-tyrosine-phosphatase n=1 Tax=Exaiptasia diaphana TaxID=2652724 RepID=A0A913X7B8_EXADI|nr:receptor-type tyrosine-protein phosphatase S-like [Exaiptasia diaphana]
MISPQIKVLLFIAVVGGPISIGKASPISLRPSIAQGVDGGQVFLQCNTTTSAKPVLKLTQNGKVMPRSRIYLSRVQGGWFIRVGPLRAGTYTLTATSGGSASSSIIFYKAKNTTVGFPKIVRNPRYRFKKSGESVTFHCSATGSPKPQIFWTKNKVPLVADKRVTMANDGRLMFTNLQKSDQGYYECVAQNLHGMVFSRRARLYIRVVQRPPRFTVKPRDQVVDPDSDVTLNCAADGFPKPSIVWERDGSRISGVLNGVLLIKKIRRSANYSCTADSYAGKVKTYAYVTVRRKLLLFVLEYCD